MWKFSFVDLLLATDLVLVEGYKGSKASKGPRDGSQRHILVLCSSGAVSFWAAALLRVFRVSHLFPKLL